MQNWLKQFLFYRVFLPADLPVKLVVNTVNCDTFYLKWQSSKVDLILWI